MSPFDGTRRFHGLGGDDRQSRFPLPARLLRRRRSPARGCGAGGLSAYCRARRRSCLDPPRSRTGGGRGRQRVAATSNPSAPLFGLPCAIKDNIDVPGLPSTSAFPPSRRIATKTGAAVQKLLDAGAIVIGKTNMDRSRSGSLACASPYGVARNAFDGAFIPGGSSAGSGVAVGAGLVSFALGNDAAGFGPGAGVLQQCGGRQAHARAGEQHRRCRRRHGKVAGKPFRCSRSRSMTAWTCSASLPATIRTICSPRPRRIIATCRRCRRPSDSASPCRGRTTSSSSAMPTHRRCLSPQSRGWRHRRQRRRGRLRGLHGNAAPLVRSAVPGRAQRRNRADDRGPRERAAPGDPHDPGIGGATGRRRIPSAPFTGLPNSSATHGACSPAPAPTFSSCRQRRRSTASLKSQPNRSCSMRGSGPTPTSSI